MVDVTDAAELKKANATMDLLNDKIPDPTKRVPLRTNGQPDKRFKKNRASVNENIVKPVETQAIKGNSVHEELLFREAMLVLMRNFDVKSVQGLYQAEKIAVEYTKLIEERFP